MVSYISTSQCVLLSRTQQSGNKFTINLQNIIATSIIIYYQIFMLTQQSQTQTSVCSPVRKAQKKQKNSVKTKTKKHKKEKLQQQENKDVKTDKKFIKKQIQQFVQEQTVAKQKKRQSKQQVKQSEIEQVLKQIQIALKPTKKSNNMQHYCHHASVYKKFLFSIIFTIVSMGLFSSPPKTEFPIAEYDQLQHNNTFKIVTDQISKTLTFNINSAKSLGVGFFSVQSVKTARVKSKVRFQLGYQFQRKRVTYRERFSAKQNHEIIMSGLKVLNCWIGDIALQNEQDGFFNKWQFKSNHQLRQYIQKNYLEKMKDNTLKAIDQKRREGYQKNAQLYISQIYDKYQSWIEYLLSRVDQLVDGGLQPYIKKLQISFSDQKQNKNNQKTRKQEQGNKDNENDIEEEL